MRERLALKPVTDEEKAPFLKTVKEYFRELNPDFVPREGWEAHYIESLRPDRALPNWIVLDEARIGFTIFGVEEHRFLPKKIGAIYEFYIVPSWRGKGLGREAALKVFERLRTDQADRIQVDVVTGNHNAAVFWRNLGLTKVSERLVLQYRQVVK
jgi:predicted acetyltransferase